MDIQICVVLHLGGCDYIVNLSKHQRTKHTKELVNVFFTITFGVSFHSSIYLLAQIFGAIVVMSGRYLEHGLVHK